MGVGEGRIELLGNVKQLLSQKETEGPIRPTDNTTIGLALLMFAKRELRRSEDWCVGSGKTHIVSILVLDPPPS